MEEDRVVESVVQKPIDMSLKVEMLGRPGADNAVYIEVNSGSSVHRLLFDCGEDCLRDLGISEIQKIDHLFFSHFHMDHVCGFDTFFRHNYNRREGPVTVWGPPGTIDVMHHRMRGFTWNLHHRQPGTWVINEIHAATLKTAVFHTRKAFAKADRLTSQEVSNGIILGHESYSIAAMALHHGSIPSMGYRVFEPDRENIDPQRLIDLDLKPGPWIKEIKEPSAPGKTIETGGGRFDVDDLREKLIVRTPGESVAYLTDFCVEPGTKPWRDLVAWLQGTGTLVSESQYLEADFDLARANFHMTNQQVARLSAEAKVGRLIIQHISRRYDAASWNRLLEEARAIFPAASFPSSWTVTRRKKRQPPQE